MQPLIEFRHATLGYGRKVVLRDVNFSIFEQEYFGLVGPNGAGKTTLLRAILGGIKPLSGEIVLARPREQTLRFGYVPQRDTIDMVLPYTVEEVVLMGRYRWMGLIGRPGREDRAIVRQSLAHVSMDDLRRRNYKDLSGGQRQRVLIARALASEPDVLILDEPTNGMDLSSRMAILELVRSLHEQGKLTVLMVSHLLDDVANYVKRIALVELGQFQVGDVDEVLTGPNLSTLYQMPVHVHTIGREKVVIAGGEHGDR
jgi:ABC-type Mn2+/Zn2+ transport system ATPase subunit